ncbi:MAG: caspase family protein [Spirochaetales bacterium]|jgi:uncharacterized caspase-like protein|nr:caspase family protein [Spirochaetales bacterium]
MRSIFPPAGIRRVLTLAAACLFLTACEPRIDLSARYAIVYGVSDYAGTGNDLNAPAADVQAMSDLLGRKDFTPFVRTDTGATKSNLALDVDTVTSLAGKDSFFLFYFSGHGTQVPFGGAEPGKQDSLDECIVLYDPADIYNGCLTDDDLMRLISRIPSRQKVVIIDACNSGGFIGDFPGVDLAPPAYSGGISSPVSRAGEAFSKYFANTGAGDIAYTEAVVIAAAGEREESYEQGIYGHGIFTYYFLQSPRKADANRDGYVTASEAYYFTKNAVVNIWNSRNPAYSFYPHISGGAMDFVLFDAD